MSSGRKHIVFIPENKHWGGSELLWSKTALWLASQNIYVTVLKHKNLKLPSWFNKESSFLSIEDVRNVKLNLFKKICNRVLPYRLRFKVKKNRDKQVRKFQPSLVVSNQGFNFNGVHLTENLIKDNVRYVIVSQAVNEGVWPNKQLRAQMKRAFLNSEKNYFVSKDNIELTQMQLGFKLANAEIVRNPFNLSYNNSIEVVKSETFNLAVVGRYHFSSKGQDVILRVLNQIKWKQRNLKVNFYGTGEDVENLRDVILNFNLTNAQLHGYTNTAQIWKHNHALLLTSRYEGLPISIVEAMLCKRFVITTNVSGNTELLTDGENAFIAEAPRPEYVDKALERAWIKRHEWKEIGQRAYQVAIKKIPEHPEEIFGQKLLSILNKE